MKYDQAIIQNAQRMAFDRMAQKAIVINDWNGTSIVQKAVKNPDYVPAKQITAPVILIQEQAYANTNQVYNFDFSINAPVASSSLNNRKLPQNNTAAVYAIQFLIGQGDSANNRVYYSTGLTVNDNSIYNSTMSLLIETDTVINGLDGQLFNDIPATPGVMDQTAGMVLNTPILFLSGRQGVFSFQVRMNNPITTLTLTGSLFLSMRLHTVMGQASA